jgi:hypothetical protein
MTRGVLEYGRGTGFESTSLVRFGPFELDLSSRELKREANCVRLQTQPLRVSARLVDTSSETHLWMKTYERTMGDCLSVQTDVASEIARSLTWNSTRASGTSRRPRQSYEVVAVAHGRDTSLKSCSTLGATPALPG